MKKLLWRQELNRAIDFGILQRDEAFQFFYSLYVKYYIKIDQL